MNFPGRSPFGSQVVLRTPEIKRIAALPRRVWSEEAGLRLAEMMTRELRTPKGTMRLRSVQAIALYEAMEVGGLFGPIRVGGGKTLLSGLLPVVLEAKRPVLLLPATLIDKTTIDFKLLREHWRIATNLQIDLVRAPRPRAKRGEAPVHPAGFYRSRRRAFPEEREGWADSSRYSVHARAPGDEFAVLSGTVMKGSIRDFASASSVGAEEPRTDSATDDEVDVWADALDEKVNPLSRRKPEALFDWRSEPLQAIDMGFRNVTSARRVFQSRLLETKGVVASSKTDGVTCSLRVSALEYQPAPITEQHIGNMRYGVKDASGEYTVLPWSTPDGWTFSQAIEFRMYLRQLALGFHSDLGSPRPPLEWSSAQVRDWAVLRARNTFEVAHARHGAPGRERRGRGRASRRDARQRGARCATRSRSSRRTCGTTIPLSRRAAEWMEREKGMVWTEHVFFARRLAQLTGAAYYGANGLSDGGESITVVKAGKAIIASVQANGTGRNLQMFSANLVTSCPPSPRSWSSSSAEHIATARRRTRSRSTYCWGVASTTMRSTERSTVPGPPPTLLATTRSFS